MTDRPKWPRAEALKVAKELCSYLEPHIERISVLGSLRRMKHYVSDVEILFIPKFIEDKGADLFEVQTVNRAEGAIDTLLKNGLLEKRPSKIGTFAWGPQNKLAIHKPTGIPVDLFTTDERRWWVAKVIRTGGKETNLQLVNGARKLGRILHAGGVFTDCDGSALEPHSEEEVFQYAGVPFAPPSHRP